MEFLDQIKDGIVSEFTGTITVNQIILSLVTTFIISLFIVYIYKKTFNGVVYSKSFALSIVLLSLTTSLIIITINSNLALSLGMVGALSIVRFRTAIKEPIDTAFMLWAITGGIMTGAGLYLVALVGSICLGLLYFASYILGFKINSQYLFVLKYELDSEDIVNKYLNKLGKYKVKSKSISGNTVELTFEVELKNNDTSIINNFNKLNGVISASIISYQNDFGA
ncbi:MAG: DUF4956 domain-containing protein [Mycoplasmatota bacterium]